MLALALDRTLDPWRFFHPGGNSSPCLMNMRTAVGAVNITEARYFSTSSHTIAGCG
jgi:hypothetical protein